MNYGQEIYNQLTFGSRRIKVFSWGAHAFKVFSSESFNESGSHLGGLLFKVNGRHFKGHVMIKLMANDTYTVLLGTLSKGTFKTKKEFTDLYCDNFAEVIDEEVEYISSYAAWYLNAGTWNHISFC